jgi:hypothetical protein
MAIATNYYPIIYIPTHFVYILFEIYTEKHIIILFTIFYDERIFPSRKF